MQHMIIAFVHHTAISEDTGEVKQDDIPKVMVEKKWAWDIRWDTISARQIDHHSKICCQYNLRRLLAHFHQWCAFLPRLRTRSRNTKFKNELRRNRQGSYYSSALLSYYSSVLLQDSYYSWFCNMLYMLYKLPKWGLKWRIVGRFTLWGWD